MTRYGEFATELGDGVDPVAEPTLFDIDIPPPVTLADRFGVPPFSVLDRRAGYWQERRNRWLRIGIESELGRDGVRTYAKNAGNDEVTKKIESYGTISIFDPVVCELVYRWFTAPGARVYDPFAGGSVRGIVASTLGRRYIGVDLSKAQVKANQAQEHLAGDPLPVWFVGDSRDVGAWVHGDLGDMDLIFTCPPYGDLEVYSDDPRDLSTMRYPDFLTAYYEVIEDAVARLALNRFAAWVISDIRDRDGNYRGLVADTIAMFRAVDAQLYNDVIILDPVASTAIRAGQSFRATRKIARCHQHLLIFAKGDPRTAAEYAKGGDDQEVEA